MKKYNNNEIVDLVNILTKEMHDGFKTITERLIACERVTEANPEALNGEQRISVLEQTMLHTGQVQNEMIQLLNQTATAVFGTQTEEQETPGKSKEEEPIVEEAVIIPEVTEEPILAVDEDDEYENDEEDDDDSDFELPPGALPISKKKY